MSGDDPTPLSIGVVFGGSPSEDRALDWALRDIGRAVIEARDRTATPLSVNVVYLVPGELLHPEFSGVRTGRFSRKRMLLLVEAAVPPEPADDPRSVLLDLLRDAIDEAEAFAIKRGIAGGLPEIRSIVEAVAQQPPVDRGRSDPLF